MKATILVGCSASGKTTLAKSLGGNVIERDAFREFILYQKRIGLKKDKEYLNIPTPENKIPENIWAHWKFNWEPEVTKLVDEAIARSAKNNMDIVISDTNLNPDRRSLLISKLEELGYDVSVEIVGRELTIDELWKRDLNRKNSVGRDVIWKQWKQFNAEFGVKKLEFNLDAPKRFLVDLDGTLSLNRTNRSAYDWDRVDEDTLNEIVYAMMLGIEQQFNCEPIFMSGRDSVCREKTIDWLYTNTKYSREWINENLYMRASGDMRSDTIVKEELIKLNNIHKKYNVICALDDRKKVIRHYHLLGIYVIDCGNPMDEF